VVYKNTYNAGNGLLLSGNSFSYTNNKAADWMKVGTLISNADKYGFAWKGQWTEEFYFGDYDCKKSGYTGWTLVSTKTFTIIDDSAEAAVTTQATKSSSTTIPATAATAAATTPVSALSGSFSGDWTTTYGQMSLVQSGNTVTGTYNYNGKISTIAGTMSGNVLSGTWTEPDRYGDFQFILSADGKSYSGKWRYRGSSDWTGTWTGTRVTTITTAVGTQTRAAVSATSLPATTRSVATPTLAPMTSCIAGAGTSVYAESRMMQQGKTVTIPVMVCNAKDMSNMDLTVSYDPAVLSFKDATKGSINFNSLFDSNEPAKGTVKIAFAANAVFSGEGSVALLNFNVIGSNGASSPLRVTVSSAGGPQGASFTIPGSSTTFVVGTPVTGDFDGDNQLTSRDALAALQISVGKRAADLSLDVTRDGSVNSMDAQKILMIAVKKV
jgi:hypothetical protein